VKRLAAAMLGTAVALAAGRAAGQQPRAQERAVGDGVERPIHDYSGEGDASSIELNPALLSAVRGVDFTALGWAPTARRVRGAGFGAFVAANLRFGLALGFGVQTVVPTLRGFDFDADRNPSLTKLSWGLSSGLGEYGAFGFAVHGLRAQGGWLRGPDLDIGLLTRMKNFGSVGLVARFAPAEGPDSGQLPREVSLVGEVAVRPLGTHHLELAGGLRSRLMSADPGEDLDVVGREGLLGRGRIAVRWQGIAIKGEVEQVATSVLDPGLLTFLRSEKAIRGSVALELSWDYAAAGVGVSAGISEGLDGVGLMARTGTRRKGRVFWPRKIDAERIALGDVDDERSLIAMLERLERARLAGKRSVLVLDAREGGAGWASLHELRQALVRVRQAGGHVFAYVEGASLKQYYVASAAEKVFAHPAGSLETYGLSATTLYFRNLLDKLGVRAEVVRIAEYKSAGEQLTETAPTAPAREQAEELQADIYEQILYDIARARGVSKGHVRELFDDAPYSPPAAAAAGLVDDVVFRDELLGEISEHIGADVEFADFPDTRPQDPTWSKRPYLAVVLVEGTIIDGENRTIPILDLKFTGGDTIAHTLRDLRGDPLCKGIVLRVNSPGGSALASDIIWREVARTRDAFLDDPKSSPAIVVSMGDVAASGGYYVSMGTRPVLADPMTITGSIGVVSLHIDVSGLLAKLGISTTTIKQGKNPDMGEPWKPLTEDQRARLTKSIQQTYDLFRKRVASGRDMTPEEVHALARGRVWSGTDAREHGLVDAHGGLAEALELVREQAKLPRWTPLETRVLPRKWRLVDVILESVTGRGNDHDELRVRGRARARTFEPPPALDRALARLPLSLLYLRPGATQALMPFELEIE
jgi:protease-4